MNQWIIPRERIKIISQKVSMQQSTQKKKKKGSLQRWKSNKFIKLLI